MKTTKELALYLESSGGNETLCNQTYTTTQTNTILAVAGCNGVVSFCTCVVAVSLVFCLRLHKLLTYRLAMYQVLSGMLFSFTLVLFFSSMNYDSDSLPDTVVCKVQAFLTEYSMWMKLLFTISLVFHLFCLAVFLKNMKNLEIWYVLFSTLFPLLVSWIPFIHNSYGVAGAWCWIRDWTGDCATHHYLEGIIEQFTLWYGPLFVSLTISIIATIIIVIVLLWRVCNAQPIKEPLLETDLKPKHKEALKELLPLLVYPAIFYCISLLPLVHRIYDAVTPYMSFKLSLAHAITISTMGLFSSSVLILHVIIVKMYHRTAPTDRPNQSTNSVHVGTLKGTTCTTNCSTAFLVPAESEADKMFDSLS